MPRVAASVSDADAGSHSGAIVPVRAGMWRRAVVRPIRTRLRFSHADRASKSVTILAGIRNDGPRGAGNPGARVRIRPTRCTALLPGLMRVE